MVTRANGGYDEHVLRKLADLSERLAGKDGRLLHSAYVQYARALADGSLLLMRDDGDDGFLEDDPIPPWPKAGEEDPLEEPFGSDADRIRQIKPEQVKKLEGGEAIEGTEPAPDVTEPGATGKSFGSADHETLVGRILHDSPDTGRVRLPAVKPLPGCGRFWSLEVIYYEHVARCDGYNYGRAYRATLLRAFAEAFRLCRQRSAACPDARLWLVSGGWGCDPDAPKPKVYLTLEFAVQCVVT